jgi:hypothetical protein
MKIIRIHAARRLEYLWLHKEENLVQSLAGLGLMKVHEPPGALSLSHMSVRTFIRARKTLCAAS